MAFELLIVFFSFLFGGWFGQMHLVEVWMEQKWYGVPINVLHYVIKNFRCI